MQMEDRITKYQVKRDPASLENVRDGVANEMQALALQVFPEERVRVLLVDGNQQPIKHKEW